MSKSLLGFSTASKGGCCKSKSLLGIDGVGDVSAIGQSLSSFVSNVTQNQNVINVSTDITSGIPDPLELDTIIARVQLTALEQFLTQFATIAQSLDIGGGDIIIDFTSTISSNNNSITIVPAAGDNFVVNTSGNGNIVFNGPETNISTPITTIESCVPIFSYIPGQLLVQLVPDDNCDRGFEYDFPEDIDDAIIGNFVKNKGFVGYNRKRNAFVFWHRARLLDETDPNDQQYRRNSSSQVPVEIDVLKTNIISSEDITRREDLSAVDPESTFIPGAGANLLISVGGGVADLIVNTGTENHNVANTSKYNVRVSETHTIGILGSPLTGEFTVVGINNPTCNVISLTPARLNLKNNNEINIETCTNGAGGINMISKDTITVTSENSMNFTSNTNNISFLADLNIVNTTNTGYYQINSNSGGTLPPSSADAGDIELRADNEIFLTAENVITLESISDYVEIKPELHVNKIAPSVGNTLIFDANICISPTFTLEVDTINEKSLAGLTIENRIDDVNIIANTFLNFDAETGITMNTTTGDIIIDTDSGDVNINGTTGISINNTVNGNLLIFTNSGNNDIQLDSNNAGVVIQANSGTIPAISNGVVIINAGIINPSGPSPICPSNYNIASNGVIRLNASDSVVIDNKLFVKTLESCDTSQIDILSNVYIDDGKQLRVDNVRQFSGPMTISNTTSTLTVNSVIGMVLQNTIGGNMTLETTNSNNDIRLNSIDASVVIQAKSNPLTSAIPDGSIMLNANIPNVNLSGSCGPYIPATTGIIQLNASDRVIIDNTLETKTIDPCGGILDITGGLCLTGILQVDTINEKTPNTQLRIDNTTGNLYLEGNTGVTINNQTSGTINITNTVGNINFDTNDILNLSADDGINITNSTDNAITIINSGGGGTTINDTGAGNMLINTNNTLTVTTDTGVSITNADSGNINITNNAATGNINVNSNASFNLDVDTGISVLNADSGDINITNNAATGNIIIDSNASFTLDADTGISIDNNGTGNINMTNVGTGNIIIDSDNRLDIDADTGITIDNIGTNGIIITNSNSVGDTDIIDIISRTSTTPLTASTTTGIEGAIHIRSTNNIEILAGNDTNNVGGYVQLVAENENASFTQINCGTGTPYKTGDIYINAGKLTGINRTFANTNVIELNSPLVRVTEGIQFCGLLANGATTITSNPAIIDGSISGQRTIWIHPADGNKLKKQIDGATFLTGGVNAERPFLVSDNRSLTSGTTPIAYFLNKPVGTDDHVISHGTATIDVDGNIDTSGVHSANPLDYGNIFACNTGNDLGANKLIMGDPLINLPLDDTLTGNPTNTYVLAWDSGNSRITWQSPSAGITTSTLQQAYDGGDGTTEGVITLDNANIGTIIIKDSDAYGAVGGHDLFQIGDGTGASNSPPNASYFKVRHDTNSVVCVEFGNDNANVETYWIDPSSNSTKIALSADGSFDCATGTIVNTNKTTNNVIAYFDGDIDVTGNVDPTSIVLHGTYDSGTDIYNGITEPPIPMSRNDQGTIWVHTGDNVINVEADETRTRLYYSDYSSIGSSSVNNMVALLNSADARNALNNTANKGNNSIPYYDVTEHNFLLTNEVSSPPTQTQFLQIPASSTTPQWGSGMDLQTAYDNTIDTNDVGLLIEPYRQIILDSETSNAMTTSNVTISKGVVIRDDTTATAIPTGYVDGNANISSTFASNSQGSLFSVVSQGLAHAYLHVQKHGFYDASTYSKHYLSETLISSTDVNIRYDSSGVLAGPVSSNEVNYSSEIFIFTIPSASITDLTFTIPAPNSNATSREGRKIYIAVKGDNDQDPIGSLGNGKLSILQVNALGVAALDPVIELNYNIPINSHTYITDIQITTTTLGVPTSVITSGPVTLDGDGSDIIDVTTASLNISETIYGVLLVSDGASWNIISTHKKQQFTSTP